MFDAACSQACNGRPPTMWRRCRSFSIVRHRPTFPGRREVTRWAVVDGAIDHPLTAMARAAAEGKGGRWRQSQRGHIPRIWPVVGTCPSRPKSALVIAATATEVDTLAGAGQGGSLGIGSSRLPVTSSNEVTRAWEGAGPGTSHHRDSQGRHLARGAPRVGGCGRGGSAGNEGPTDTDDPCARHDDSPVPDWRDSPSCSSGPLRHSKSSLPEPK